MDLTRKLINASIAVVLLVVGVGGMYWLVRTKPQPPIRTGFTRSEAVAVTPVVPQVEAAPVVGYGTVRPKNQVSIVPQVSGQLVHTHKELAQGNIIPAGEILFEIDDTIYQARVKQAEAEVAGLEAALARHRQEIRDLDDRIATAHELLAIEERTYQTDKNLFEDGAGTQAQVDLVYQKYLMQKDAVADLENRRALGPYVESELQAKLEAAQANLTQAQYQLDNTKIKCPFRARVEGSNAYRSQVVTAHLSIATLTDMEAFELSVGIDPRDLRWLAPQIRPAALSQNDGDVLPGPEVRVSSSLPGRPFGWVGHVSRFERVDETTRTARLVVEIRDFEVTFTPPGTDPSAAPELSIGMHCRADLPVEPLEDALVVPRHALYENGWVYVFEPDPSDPTGRRGHLGRREVPVLRSVGSAVLVDYRGRESDEPCELKPGDQLIVSPITRAVVGMDIVARDAQKASSVDLTVRTPPSFEWTARLASDSPRPLPVLPLVQAN
ncbi:MAG: hypothetical protein J5J06_19560 [Phycisphaerae bacterium]|nr:hypothetical protein [Phycisphaerae bacterium]